MPSMESEMDPLLRELILASATMHPDDLPGRIRDAAERAGGTDVELLAVDLAQQDLLPLLPGDHRSALPVVGSPAGDSYRHTAVVQLVEPGGTRLWVPVMDSAERVGVLGVLHLAILDAMGHGLEASRMANTATAAARASPASWPRSS